jgi:hypothetical protein
LGNYGTIAVGNAHNEGRYFNGDIGEFLIYNRALDPDELAFVNQFLAIRHGLVPEPVSGPGFHTGFSISADGETIVLTRPDPIHCGSHAGCGNPPGLQSWPLTGRHRSLHLFFRPHTRRAEHLNAYGPPVDPPSFSQHRGIREAAFDLTLAHPDPLVAIRYTTDGSEPGPSNGTTYAGPLSIGSTTVIRAAAIKTGALPLRRIVTHSYLFHNDIIQVTSRPGGLPRDVERVHAHELCHQSLRRLATGI